MKTRVAGVATRETGYFDMYDRIDARRGIASLAPLVLALLLGACAGNDVSVGIEDERLTPCPETPNCVSSDARDDEHRVAPYRLKVSPEEAWQGLREVVEAQERVTVITSQADYLHVEVRSRIFRFVDDTEFHLRPADGIIAVRSAARVGYGDMGVNRQRVETIREALRARGLIE